MKVHELMKFLASCDADADVLLSSQPSYPIEYSVGGIVVRENVCDDEGHRRAAVGSALNDVLLVEGAWLRYGDRAAWASARRS